MSISIWRNYAKKIVRRDDNPMRPILTQREIIVLEYVMKGFTDRQIASELGISNRTVEGYVYNTMRVLKAKTRTEAVV